MLPKSVAVRVDVSAVAKSVYAVLWTRKNGDNFSWPSQDYIATQVACSVRNVQRGIKELVDKRILRRTRRGLGKSNVYSFPDGTKLSHPDTTNLSHPDTTDSSHLYNVSEETNIRELLAKPTTTKKSMKIYAESDEVPTIKEGDPTPVKGPRNRKHSESSIKDMDALIGLYTQLYLKYIGKTIPYTNRALVYRNMAEPLKHYGLPRMKELLEAYIASNEHYYRNEKWNILVFLSMRTLNKLEQ